MIRYIIHRGNSEGVNGKDTKVDMEPKDTNVNTNVPTSPEECEGINGYEHLNINNYVRVTDEYKKKISPIEPKILTFTDMLNIVDEHLIKGMSMYIVKYHTGIVDVYTDRDNAIWNYVTDLIDKLCEDNNMESIADEWENSDSTYMDEYGYKNWEKYWRRDMENEYRKVTLYNDTKVDKDNSYLMDYLVNCSTRDNGITKDTDLGVGCIVGVGDGDTLCSVSYGYMYNGKTPYVEDTEDNSVDSDEYDDDEVDDDDRYDDWYRGTCVNGEVMRCNGDCKHCKYHLARVNSGNNKDNNN